MLKSYNKIKYFIFCIVFIIFTLAPIHITHAEFSDSVSQTVGIKLELGSIDLTMKENTHSRTVRLDKGQSKVQLEETLQNNGSLTGQLAYKITFKDTISGNIIMQQDYTMLTDNLANALTLEPNESKNVSIDVNIALTQDQINNTQVQIDFLLFQSNGTIENPMFSDNVTTIYYLDINNNGEEIIPPEENDPKDYWPTIGWIDHGNVRYNKENYSPVMYFSEIKNSQQIKNLNDIIFYIDIKDKNGIELTDLTIRSPEDMIIKVEHINDNKQHLKVTISIDKNKFNRNILSVPVYDYSIAFNNGNNFELSEEDEPITLKRILLSTDEAGTRTFNVRPINLFAEERDIYLAQTEQDNTSYLTTPLTKIPVVKSSEIAIEVSGDNKELVEAKKIQTEANSFTLKPKSQTEKKKTAMELRAFLEGTSGETLEVKRGIQLLPTTNETIWPQEMTTIWGTPDGKGNYGNKPIFNLKIVNNKFVSTNSSSIYVNNPFKEELQFAQNNSENFFNQTIFYSPSGEYMKVDLKFTSNNLKPGTRPGGFSFIVFREKNINLSNPEHVHNTWVEIDYVTAKEIARYNQNKMAVEEASTNTEVSYKEQLIQAITNGDKELYIDYNQLPREYDFLRIEEDISKMLNIQGDEIDFIIEDVPELKAIKLTIQE